MKHISVALLTSTLLAGTAFAQSSPPPAQPRQQQPTAAAPATAPTVQKAGQWRGSKLIGLNVYNNNNDKIGDIKEIIADANGKIDLVVIGVGGFLGMGEHNVGLAWNQIKFVNEDVRRTNTTGTGAPARQNNAAAPARQTTAMAARDYPDHAVVNMTKDQLKSLPAFKYASDAK
jgi:hypothetical protein